MIKKLLILSLLVCFALFFGFVLAGYQHPPTESKGFPPPQPKTKKEVDLIVEKIWAEYAPNIEAPPGKKFYFIYFTIKNIGSKIFGGTLKIKVTVVPSPPPGPSIWAKYEGKLFKGNPLTIPNFKLFPNAVWKSTIVGPPIEIGWLSGTTRDVTVGFSTDNLAEYSKNNEKTQKLTLPD